MSIGEVETIEATTTTPLLSQPIAFRGVTLRNRSVGSRVKHIDLDSASC
jgi:hypothetical protein